MSWKAAVNKDLEMMDLIRNEEEAAGSRSWRGV